MVHTLKDVSARTLSCMCAVHKYDVKQTLRVYRLGDGTVVTYEYPFRKIQTQITSGAMESKVVIRRKLVTIYLICTTIVHPLTLI